MLASSARVPRWMTAAVFLAALAWGLLNYSLFFRGANTYEFGHYAEIGRNIAEGHGWRTRVVYPATLKMLEGNGLAAEPYLPVNNRFPLPSYISALFQKAGGSTDFFAVFGTIAAFAAWAALVFRAGARAMSPGAGVLAALIFVSLPAGSKYFVLFNLPDVLFGALVFALHELLTRSAAATPRSAAAGGLLAGLAWLTRSNLWLWLPLYLFALLKPAAPPRRPALAFTFLGVFAAVVAPAVVYNLHWFGSIMPTDLPLFLAHKTLQQDQPWLSPRLYDAWSVMREHHAAVLRLSLDRLHTLVLEAPTLWQMQLLWPLAAVGATHIAGTQAMRLVWLTAAAAALQAAVFAPLGLDSWGLGVGYRYLYWLCPWIVLAAVWGARSVSREWSAARRRGLLAAWLVAQAVFLAPFYTHDLTSIQLRHPSGRPPREWPELIFLRDRAGDEGVVSNLPAHVGWYARAPAVALPNDPEDVPAVAALRPTRYLYISFLNIGTLGDLPRWLKLLSPDPEGLRAYCDRRGYRIVATFPGAGVIVDLKPPPAPRRAAPRRKTFSPS